MGWEVVRTKYCSSLKRVQILCEVFGSCDVSLENNTLQQGVDYLELRTPMSHMWVNGVLIPILVYVMFQVWCTLIVEDITCCVLIVQIHHRSLGFTFQCLCFGDLF